MEFYLQEVIRKVISTSHENIGSWITLYNPIRQQFRYLYCSTNQYLFDRPKDVSTRADSNTFFQKILELNIKNRYYCQWPGSS